MIINVTRWCLLVALFMVAGCGTVGRKTVLPEPCLLGREWVSEKQGSPSHEIMEPTEEIFLSEALSLALVKSPVLKAFSWELRSSEAMKLQTGLFPNPETTLDVAEYDTEGTGFDTAETSIVLSQVVQLGGKRRKRMAVAELESGLAGWDYEARRLDVFVETTQAFIDVLAAQESLSLAKEAVDLSEKVYDAVRERVRAGKVSPLEENRASVELSMSKMGLARSMSELETARMRLVRNWGSMKPSFAEASGKFDVIMNSIPSIASLEGYVAQNPDVARWQMEVALRDATIAMERSLSIPDMAASAGVQQFEATGEDAMIFGVAVTLPVFDRNQGAIRSARHQRSKADEERKAVELGVRGAMTEAYNELTMSHMETVTFQKEILPVAQRAFQAARDGYQEGKLEYLDVLDAQRTMFDVREKYVAALSSYHKAVVVLERLIGRPIDSEDEDEDEKK